MKIIDTFTTFLTCYQQFNPKNIYHTLIRFEASHWKILTLPTEEFQKDSVSWHDDNFCFFMLFFLYPGEIMIDYLEKGKMVFINRTIN